LFVSLFYVVPVLGLLEAQEFVSPSPPPSSQVTSKDLEAKTFFAKDILKKTAKIGLSLVDVTAGHDDFGLKRIALLAA